MTLPWKLAVVGLTACMFLAFATIWLLESQIGGLAR